METKKFEILPRHIGFIMDGNGRWAKNQGLKRGEGHIAGAKVFKKIGEYCADLGIECATFYAFSTENWSRPQEEVDGLMDLFIDYLIDGDSHLEENKERQMRLKFIGEREGLPEELIELIEKAENQTKDYNKITINVALNYGGRAELVHSVKAIAEKVKNGEIGVDDINEDLISSNIYTSGQPDPDIIVRPSGEYRLSNFLTWQSAYSELWFSDILWPDFTTDDVDVVLEDYQKRHRRFGGV